MLDVVDRAWIIDPKRRMLHDFQADASPLEYPEDDTITHYAVLPDFSGKVQELFEG